MGMAKNVKEYGAQPLGLRDVDGKAVALTTGNIMRLNRPHAIKLLIDIANGADDGTAGGVMNIEFDYYNKDGTTILWTGIVASAIPIHVDLQAAIEFGGGVTPFVSDGTLNDDAKVLQIFTQIAFRVNVTVASNDTGTCLINVVAHVQE